MIKYTIAFVIFCCIVIPAGSNLTEGVLLLPVCVSVHPVTLILHLSKHAHHRFELESLNLNETCILAPLKWVFNSLWPNDATWRHRSGSRLAQVMACCLMAPSHYLSQCWLIISKVPWHSSLGIIIRRSEVIDQWNRVENFILKWHFGRFECGRLTLT